ncbi:hypothetical protein HW932_14025 [Allochromatium humboldtianum]|uniref:DUF4148 domain-containing protein n=1 Tax=Allochromatium humboldtianum TaxID=504901 RepID=A0A850RAP2_9GAMM|nr:hypothetical protein [Allochromatium humboldtianum]NVZ10378.1 hypothetical protein [Allochromatium humboldtianum]
MRKTTIIMLAVLIATPAAGQSISASAMKAERDRMETGEGVRFLDAVPAWGDPARVEAANRSAQETYNQQVMEAEAANSITQMRATQYQADQADQQSRRRTERLLDDMGTPSSVYRSGSYESRTYQSGNTIQTIRMKDGKITGSSTYRSNR